MIRLYIARHGETKENAAGILQGHLPGELTERGREQARVLRDHLAATGAHFDAFLVSDLRRTLETAAIVDEALKLPIRQEPLLRERDWGSLTGMAIADLQGRPFPADVETVEAMTRRAYAFLRMIHAEYEGKTVLALGHGLFNRCILGLIAGVPISEVPRMGNAEVRSVELHSLPPIPGSIHAEDTAPSAN